MAASKPTVTRTEAEYPELVRNQMMQGSLNLRGVAATLRRLSEDFSEDHERVNSGNGDAAVILGLLAKDVDLEADAMGDAEAFLLNLSKPVA